MYGHPQLNDLNEARYVIFNKMTGSVNNINSLANVKRINCALLPPCTNTLQKKIQRVQYLRTLWHHADMRNPSDGIDPTSFGWKKESTEFAPEWFDGSSVPLALIQDNTPTDETQLDKSMDSDHDDLDEQWTKDKSESETDVE
ncbi:hypothetical protein Pcinc_025860 [Petrolisthes cinctipes]|uniref:Uncharacterized protein n=1 Tax=Petrolisthes cinctipes TaxID=88211 RepID=A0AAE1KBB2_PETCI|nr:hypothetical protein Pcinc_025860 [Petrolisthes cinctipes]